MKSSKARESRQGDIERTRQILARLTFNVASVALSRADIPGEPPWSKWLWTREEYERRVGHE